MERKLDGGLVLHSGCLDGRRYSQLEPLSATFNFVEGAEVEGAGRLACSTEESRVEVVVRELVRELVDGVAERENTWFVAGDEKGDEPLGGEPLAESTPKERKKPVKWSLKEREWLYECYLTSYKPGLRTGYLNSTFELYRVRMGEDGYRERNIKAMTNQLTRLKHGQGLSEMQFEAVRMKVLREKEEWHGKAHADALAFGNFGRLEEATRVGKGEEIEEDKEIDFSVDEGGVIKTRESRMRTRGTLNGPKLNETPRTVEVLKAEPRRPKEKGEEIKEDERKEQEFVFTDHKLNTRMRVSLGEVVIEETKVDTWKEEDGTIRDLSTEEKEVLTLLRKMRDNRQWKEVPNLRAADRRKVAKEVRLVDGVMHNLLWQGMGVARVNRLLYAGGAVVALRLGLKLGNKKKGKAMKPQWQRRIERNLLVWRRHLSQIEEIRRGKAIGERSREELERKYKLTDRGALTVGTFLRNKIQAGTTKIRWHEERKLTRRQNNLFQNNQRQLFKELGGDAKSTNEIPDAAKSKAFWEELWSKPQDFVRDSDWLGDIRMRLREVETMADVVVDIDMVKKGIGRMANWRAPGPDMVRGFWFKKLSSLHQVLCDALKECVEQGQVPDWMVKGRTVLLQKDPAKGNAESNYRPIACLPLMWKLLTGIFAEQLYDHLHRNGLLPNEQKGCRKNSRGTKDQLLIDREILREARRKKRHLAMVWIDYRKAYDMLPHSWLLESLSLVGCANNIHTLIKGSMPNWKTVLTAGGQVLGEVAIRRGIFQGDSLSPLLFVVAMIPMSMLLKREKMGYRLGGQTGQGTETGCRINHLLFMDDLKIYGANWEEAKNLTEIVQKFSADIGMEFGLDKCAVLELRGGVKVRADRINLPDGKAIEEVGDDGYKYLGVFEGADIMSKEMKEIVRKEYLNRVKKVAESKLHAGNLLNAVNSWAVSVVRYTAGILCWTQKELEAMDIKTRKRLTMNWAFHKRSNVDRLYMKRKVGGRGLMSVEECVRTEERALKEYVTASDEPMLIEVAAKMAHVGDDEPAADFRKRMASERMDRLMAKGLHGKFFNAVKEVASDRSWQWLRGGYLYKRTEGFVCAAQEDVIYTRNYCSSVAHMDVENKCRMCGEPGESIRHLVSGSTMLAQREYRRRHDTMGLRVYWEVCGNLGLKRSEKWHQEVPEGVRKSADGSVEVWWDQKVVTPTYFEASRPDMVVIDRTNRKWLLVDFSVPYDANVAKKEKEKIDKYRDLAAELARMHNVNVEVVPIVVGSLGVVTKDLPRWLKLVGVGDIVGGLQTSAIIGTAAILRKVLRTP